VATAERLFLERSTARCGQAEQCAPWGKPTMDSSTLKKMTKPQLIEAVAAKTGREKPEVEAVLESVLGTIAEALQANQRVDLRGFGSFVVKQKKERQGRNPRTGETITIAAKRDAGFKAGKELSQTLIESKTEE
jgi:nucleoid DNA-binding protein